MIIFGVGHIIPEALLIKFFRPEKRDFFKYRQLIENTQI